MPTYFEAETGAETSQPRVGIHIAHGSKNYRIASGDEDLVIGGETYEVGTVTHDEIEITTAKGRTEFTFALPLSHPFSRRWLLQLLPPRRVTVTAWLMNLGTTTGPKTIRIWSGRVTNMIPNDRAKTATFKSRPRMGDLLDQKVSNVVTGKRCPHKLGDTMCKVDMENAANVQETTIVSGAGTATIIVASMAFRPDGWGDFGYVYHVLTGEVMEIAEHVGTTIVMRLPLPELRTGHEVKIYRGCKHTIDACREDFANVPNMGGQPQMIPRQPFSLGNLGALLRKEWA